MNEYCYHGETTADFAAETEGLFWTTRWCAVGLFVSGGSYPDNGALRFLDVNIAQGTTVNAAQIRFHVDASERSGSGQINSIIWGIDEDNTSDFSSNPFGRTKTTAQTTVNVNPSGGDWVPIDVTSIVNEILARPGWSSGNSIGFIWEDNGTTSSNGSNEIVDDSLEDEQSYLWIRPSAEPDTTPTPGSINAPDFPSTKSWGLKMSEPGVDVKTATEDQLYFTTAKRTLKVKEEAEVSCTGGVLKNVAHNLSYTPAVLGWVEGGGYRFKLNRDFDGATDPVGGGVQGYIGADSTNLKITLASNGDVYYYILIDPIEE